MLDVRAQRILRQHVLTDRLLGVSQVPMGQVVTPVVAPPPSPAQKQSQPPPAPSRSFKADARPAPAAAAAASPTREPMVQPFERLDRKAKLRVLQTLDSKEVQSCTKCPLCESRTQTVFGEGDPDAPLMFIGEGPGQTEDETGRPFVGKAGQLLEKMIIAMGLSREKVYIANVVKCRPPNNRTPTPAEVDTCWSYLRTQIATICPKAIVTLGGPATKMLLDTKVGITALRGVWHSYDELVPVGGPSIPVMPTFHPAYVLRQYTTDTRGKVWSDLQAVMKHLAN